MMPCIFHTWFWTLKCARVEKGEEGGQPKVYTCGQGEWGWSKYAKNVRTSFTDGPEVTE